MTVPFEAGHQGPATSAETFRKGWRHLPDLKNLGSLHNTSFHLLQTTEKLHRVLYPEGQQHPPGKIKNDNTPEAPKGRMPGSLSPSQSKYSKILKFIKNIDQLKKVDESTSNIGWQARVQDGHQKLQALGL
jgi:hypothetical protein